MADAEEPKPTVLGKKPQNKVTLGHAVLVLSLALIAYAGISYLGKTWEKSFQQRYEESTQKEVAQYMSLKKAPAEEWRIDKTSEWAPSFIKNGKQYECQTTWRTHLPTGINEDSRECRPEGREDVVPKAPSVNSDAK